MNLQKSVLDSALKFQSSTAPFTSASDSSNFLSAPSTVGLFDVPCILGDGSRINIHRRRKSWMGVSCLERHTVATPTEQLLDKTMPELVHEAETIQLNGILSAKAFAANGSASAVCNDSSSLWGRSDGTVNNSLWVDKYSPQSFTQVSCQSILNNSIIFLSSL